MNVWAVIPIIKIDSLLQQVIDALENQTIKLQGIVLVDNGQQLDITSLSSVSLPVHVLRIPQNTGSAGGFAIGVKYAAQYADWVWTIDSDSVVTATCLEELLKIAVRPNCVAIAPTVMTPTETYQYAHRGIYRHGHAIALPADAYQQTDPVALDYSSYLGTLVKSDVIQHEVPDARFFLWVDDLEWSLRLRRYGDIWLAPQAIITHHDDAPSTQGGLFGTLSNHIQRPSPKGDLWRYLYAFRNASWMRRQYHNEPFIGWLIHWTIQSARALIRYPHPLQAAIWFWRYGMAGRNGKWAVIDPMIWQTTQWHDPCQAWKIHPITSPFTVEPPTVETIDYLLPEKADDE